MFNKAEEEIVVCSPMEGVITLDGKPAAGARVERSLSWKDKAGEKDSVRTDDQGVFTLPLKTDTLALGKFSQLVINQEIVVIYREQEYLIWTMGKGSKDIYGELGGKPSNFRCELNDEMVRVDVPDGLLGTSCKWDSID